MKDFMSMKNRKICKIWHKNKRKSQWRSLHTNNVTAFNAIIIAYIFPGPWLCTIPILHLLHLTHFSTFDLSDRRQNYNPTWQQAQYYFNCSHVFFPIVLSRSIAVRICAQTHEQGNRQFDFTWTLE